MEKYEEPKLVEISALAEASFACAGGSAYVDMAGCVNGGTPTTI